MRDHKIVCDRCGAKELDSRSADKGWATLQSLRSAQVIDLCPVCADLFQRWLGFWKQNKAEAAAL